MKKKLSAMGFFLLWTVLLGFVVYSTINRSQPKVVEKKEDSKQVVIKEKTGLEKQAVMKEDFDTMTGYGLYYDYSSLTLQEVIKSYLEERGFDEDQVAVSYKNLETGELIGYNDTLPMTAASTYKLPLNMLVVDGVEEGIFSMDKRYDITQDEGDQPYDYSSYIAQFGDSMTISEMQEYSIEHSENTPAYGLIKMLGGYDKAFAMMDRYGVSASDKVKTMTNKPKQTTTDYYIQVLEHLYNNQKKYKDILHYMYVGFNDSYIKTLLPDVEVYQKVGYYAEAQNAGGIVYEDTPYLVAIYTARLGVMDANNPEEWYGGAFHLGEIAYIVNEWHRVNRN